MVSLVVVGCYNCSMSAYEMDTSSFCSLGNAQTPNDAPPATAVVARTTFLILTRNLIAFTYNCNSHISSFTLLCTVYRSPNNENILNTEYDTSDKYFLSVAACLAALSYGQRSDNVRIRIRQCSNFKCF